IRLTLRSCVSFGNDGVPSVAPKSCVLCRLVLAARVHLQAFDGVDVIECIRSDRRFSKGTGRHMTQNTRLGKIALTLFLAACTARPLPTKASPATPANPAAKPTRASRTRHRYVRPEKGVDPTIGDIASNDDPIVRAAAVEALGRYNGSVVAVDPNTGRILTVVNQKMAYSDGAIPCSTIKPTIALAALEESIITRDTMLRVGRRKYMNLTDAMAHSNNEFFETLGTRMGFDTVSRYGRLLGLGELAGYNLADEHPGSFPMAPPAKGGVARMSSFGEGIQVTPLQLASLAAAFA